MANYYDFENTISLLEGGYQNRKDDAGNKNSRGEFVGTNYGISAPVYERWIGYPPTENDMRSITKTIASEIFKANYWNKLSASYIESQAVAETLVDHAINAGVRTAAKIIQKTLNKRFGTYLVVDGVVGALTLEAINSAEPILLFNEFSLARIEDYKTKRNQAFWLPIWINRVYSIANKFGIPLKKK